jgi:hypothetical protein
MALSKLHTRLLLACLVSLLLACLTLVSSFVKPVLSEGPVLLPVADVLPTAGGNFNGTKIRLVHPNDSWIRRWLKKPRTFAKVKLLFDLRPIEGGEKLRDIEKVDVFSWKTLHMFTDSIKSQTDNHGAIFPPTFISNAPKNMALFNDKTEWLQYMRDSLCSELHPLSLRAQVQCGAWRERSCYCQ